MDYRGGTQEGTEKPLDTIKRELLEEINLSLLNINKFITIKLESNLFNPKILRFLIDIYLFVN